MTNKKDFQEEDIGKRIRIVLNPDFFSDKKEPLDIAEIAKGLGGDIIKTGTIVDITKDYLEITTEQIKQPSAIPLASIGNEETLQIPYSMVKEYQLL
ncbi:hypothetical protein GOV03_04060 [Candidatus Woesearchaeota archaeon]|nr:hypothetical protein [Candidatus Woesearchaeota archaeon]